MMDGYRDDLAYIHDAAFGYFARSAAPVLLEALQARGMRSGLVVDLGCGSGILAAKISAAGYDVLGVDLSAAMIALARERVPKGEFRQESLFTAALPSCVAITAIGECINYRFDRRNSDAALRGLFRRVHRALCPGGVFLFDVAEPGRAGGPGLQEHFREGPDWAVLVTTGENREKGLLLREITSFRKVGELYRREKEVHWLRLLRSRELAQQLREIGFRVRLLRSYGGFRFPQGYVGLLGRKT
jgi:SAM-dependent methyltransferase